MEASCKADGTTEELTTQNGVINLKPNETITIDKIPVETILNVSINKTDNYGVKTIACTNSFKPVSNTNTITGKITDNKNIETLSIIHIIVIISHKIFSLSKFFLNTT